MLYPILALAAAFAVPQAAPATDSASEAAGPTILGEWRGALSPGGGQTIPLVLHVGGSSGRWTATLDSPAQGAMGLPVTSVTQEKDAVRFDLTAPRASYVATLSKDGRTLSGNWMQGPGSIPLTMTRGDAGAPVSLRRPQTPEPPFPYRSEEVGYDNAAGPAHLAGTLTLPSGKGPFPSVLLITGSGQQDRDETVFGHKPFLLWADYLTRRGLAVLRVDDRGIGGSTGEVRKATTADFAGDAAAGVAFLRSRAEIDPKRVGLIGHSEGAVIAPMVAARDPAIAFIVLLAGSGEPGEELLLEQKRRIETASGLKAEVVEQSSATMRRLYDAVKDAPDQASADKALSAQWSRIAGAGGSAAAPLPTELEVVASPWLRWFIGHDPRPVLTKVACPVLAIGGEKDMQVAPGTNLAGIRTALRHNKDATVIELPGLNHLFQSADSGQVAEYGRIEQTIAPVALKTVGDWIVAQVPRTKLGMKS